MKKILKTRIHRNFYIKTFSPLFVLVLGFMVSAAWVLDIDYLKSLHVEYVTMKFTTSIGFLICGLHMITYKKGTNYFAGMLLASVIYIVSSWTLGKPACFLPAFEESALLSLRNDFPSLITIFCFFIFSLPIFRRIIGAILIVISITAILGYALNIKMMYFYVENVSTAMALHTAILFLHCGVWLYNPKKN